MKKTLQSLMIYDHACNQFCNSQLCCNQFCFSPFLFSTVSDFFFWINSSPLTLDLQQKMSNKESEKALSEKGTVQGIFTRHFHESVFVEPCSTVEPLPEIIYRPPIYVLSLKLETFKQSWSGDRKWEKNPSLEFTFRLPKKAGISFKELPNELESI